MTITTKIWILVGLTVWLWVLKWFILRQMESLESKIVRISASKLKDSAIHPRKGQLEMRILELHRMLYSMSKIGMYFLIGKIFLLEKIELIESQSHLAGTFYKANFMLIAGGLVSIIFMLVEINQYNQKRKRIIKIGKSSTVEHIECLRRRDLTYLPIKTVIEYKGIVPWLIILPNLLEIPSIGSMYMRNFVEPSEEYLNYLFQREPSIAKWSITLRNVGLVMMWLMIVGYTFQCIHLLNRIPGV